MWAPHLTPRSVLGITSVFEPRGFTDVGTVRAGDPTERGESQMNWRRVSIALMAVGLLFAATSTYGAGIISADRVGQINSIGDDADSEDANYFDTADVTYSFTTIDGGADRVLMVFNHFTEPLTATRVAVTAVQPIDPGANNTTTDPAAVQMVSGANTFDEGDTVDPGGDAALSLTCNPAFNETVNAAHELTVALAVEGAESDTRISLDRTVTAKVECNA